MITPLSSLVGILYPAHKALQDVKFEGSIKTPVIDWVIQHSRIIQKYVDVFLGIFLVCAVVYAVRVSVWGLLMVAVSMVAVVYLVWYKNRLMVLSDYLQKRSLCDLCIVLDFVSGLPETENQVYEHMCRSMYNSAHAYWIEDHPHKKDEKRVRLLEVIFIYEKNWNSIALGGFWKSTKSVSQAGRELLELQDKKPSFEEWYGALAETVRV